MYVKNGKRHFNGFKTSHIVPHFCVQVITRTKVKGCVINVIYVCPPFFINIIFYWFHITYSYSCCYFNQIINNLLSCPTGRHWQIRDQLNWLTVTLIINSARRRYQKSYTKPISHSNHNQVHTFFGFYFFIRQCLMEATTTIHL